MTGHQYSWTIASALYQLRWEPSERRTSAVDYLTSVIVSGPNKEVAEIASGLLDLAVSEPPPDDASPANRDLRDARPVTNAGHRCLTNLGYGPDGKACSICGTGILRCAVCNGPLEVSDQRPNAGYLHANDADDTHVPQYHAGESA